MSDDESLGIGHTVPSDFLTESQQTDNLLNTFGTIWEDTPVSGGYHGGIQGARLRSHSNEYHTDPLLNTPDEVAFLCAQHPMLESHIHGLYDTLKDAFQTQTA